MRRIGDDPKLRAELKRVQSSPKLPRASDVPRKVALALVESCRQGTAPVQGALVLSVGRRELIEAMRHDLESVASRGSRLCVINGAFGMGKTLALRVLQAYGHLEGFASSLVTLSSRECPIYDLTAMYRHIVKNIRVAGCLDGPALEQILDSWARRLKDSEERQQPVMWALSELDPSFKCVLTQYYEGIRLGRVGQTCRALRWLCGEATLADARQLGIASVIGPDSALAMLGNLTRLLRFVGTRGLVVLLDEVDAISSLCYARKSNEAYANLLALACAASSTPYSYFVYATTPTFLDRVPPGFGDALRNVITLEQLKSKELLVLAGELRDLHFRAYEWQSGCFSESPLRRFMKKCLSGGVGTPRDFVRAVVAVLDMSEENRSLSLDEIACLVR